MYAPLEATTCPPVMSLLEVSPVKTSALPGKARGLTVRGLVFGGSSRESLASYDPEWCVWRTSRRSLFEDLTVCSLILPRTGMTRNGRLYQQPRLMPRTSEKDFSLWPTPNASPLTSSVTLQKSGDGRTKPNKLGWAASEKRFWPTPTVNDAKNATLSPSQLERDSLVGHLMRENSPTGQAEESSSPIPSQQLNPAFMEWLMGFPAGWVNLKRSGTP